MMKKIIIASILISSTSVFAQVGNSTYLKNVRATASTFHKNFSKGDFDKNAALVNDKIYVNSNAAISVGKDKFINDIKRFSVAFPGLQVEDKVLIFDGNQVGLLFYIQGQQEGQLGPLPATHKKVSLMGAEFFTMDSEAKLKELITITPAETMFGQLTGAQDITSYEKVSVLSNNESKKPINKQLLKNKMENFVDDFNVRNFEGIKTLFDANVSVVWNGKKL